MKTRIGLMSALWWIIFLSAEKTFSQQGSIIDPPGHPPVPYTSLREADMMWSKRIWRFIDLDEKINLPLKYPSSESTTDRRNLIDVLMDAIASGNLTAYSYIDDEFTMPITLTDIETHGGARVDTIDMPDSIPPYNPIRTIVKRDFSRDKVIGYRLKEDWYFDKRRSVMEVRIVGIAPVIYAVDEAGNPRERNLKTSLFWIYFPDARKALASAEVFNRGNDAQRLSFDDLFQKRLFGSVIYKESNVYDRLVQDYSTGVSALLESERIKGEVVAFEEDMWEY